MTLAKLLRSWICFTSTVLLFGDNKLDAQLTPTPTDPPQPQLNGWHFRITAIEEPGFVESRPFQDGDSTSLSYSGYLIDILENLSKRANFTYELLRPSGFASLCKPRRNYSQETIKGHQDDEIYSVQYNCGQTDVTDLPRRNHSTDFYWGLFYLTPHRQLISRTFLPIHPPATGALTMVGTATHLLTIADLEERGLPACGHRSAAYLDFLRETFPNLPLVEIQGTDVSIVQAMTEGVCDVYIVDWTFAINFVVKRFNRDECQIRGKPVGVIGEPLNFGLSDYSVGGAYKALPSHVVDTIDYWLNVFMICSPFEVDGLCQRDSLVRLYEAADATGKECGYVNFPSTASEDPILSPEAVTGVVLGAVGLSVALLTLLYFHKLRQQRHRIRKRFVQQIARNIDIGPSPSTIPAYKLAEQVQHIGDSRGHITKEALSRWMNDVKMCFLSEKDFNALWAAMDTEGSGIVDPVEFFVFLSGCGPQFEEVYNEQLKLPKSERLKLAVRRLTNLQAMGEDGVRRSENSLDRASRNGFTREMLFTDRTESTCEISPISNRRLWGGTSNTD